MIFFKRNKLSLIRELKKENDFVYLIETNQNSVFINVELMFIQRM